MAINGGNVDFRFTGDSSDLNDALAKAGKNLDGLTVAGQGVSNKLSGDLVKSSKAASNAFASTTGQTKSLTGSMSSLGHILHSIALPRSGLSMVANKMIEMGGAGRTLVSMLGRMNPVMLGITAVAAALGGAYALLKEDTEGLAKANEELAKRQKDVTDAMSTGEDALFDARSELAALSGAFNEMDIATQKATNTANAKFAPSMQLVNSHLAEQEERVRMAKIAMEESGNTIGAEADKYEKLKKVVEGLNEVKGVFVAQEDELVAVLTETAERKAEIAADEEAEAEAEKARSDERRARLKREADAAIKAARAAIEADDEKAESAQDYAKAHADAAASVALDDAAEIANTQRAADEAKQAYLDRIDYQGDFVSASGDLAVALTERLGASAKTQAMVAYAASKASAISQIMISSMVAAAKVTEQTGIGAILAVPAVAALTAVQMAAVLATPPPKFHSGGMIAPDERMITAQTGEAVLSRSGVAAAGGASGVNSLNRGGGGGAIVVVNQYRHRVFDSFIMDNLRRTGSPLAAAIGATGNKAGILR